MCGFYPHPPQCAHWGTFPQGKALFFRFFNFLSFLFFRFFLRQHLVDKQLICIVHTGGQHKQGNGGGNGSCAGQNLADPQVAPHQAVGTQTLDEGSAQTVPGGIAQGDLTIKLPLFGQEMQQQEI